MIENVGKRRITIIIGTILFIILFGFLKTILLVNGGQNLTYSTVINGVLFFIFYGLLNMI